MEETKEEVQTDQISDKYLNAKKYNTKLFPFYKMFSWDLVFYYSISFLFLTQTKGLSASNVLFADASYRAFKIVFEIPCVSIVEKTGLRRGLLIGSLLVTLSIFILILSQNLLHLIIANAVMAFGYSLKDLCDSTFLRECITDKNHPGTAFTSIDGKGSSYYYWFDAITSIACGFLFVINGYLPMLLCLCICIISCVIAINFKIYKYPRKNETSQAHISYRQHFKDIKTAFRSILQSNRLKALFMFSGVFVSFLSIRTTLASSLFEEIGVNEEYFGIIFAVLTILSAISAKHQDFFHKKLKNKVLTYFSLGCSCSMMFIGLIALYSNNFNFAICSILILYAIQYIAKGAFYTLQKRYLNSFSNSSISPKIYSLTALIESLASTIMCYVASLLLGFASTSYVIAALGCAFTVAFIFILDYMKSRIGLKPEEYKNKDIHFTEVH